MNTLKFINWSERQQVLAVILMAGIAISILWFFALIPLSTKQSRLEKQIESMRQQLQAKNFYLGEEVLAEKKDGALKNNRALHDEWSQMVQRVSVLPRRETATASPGHIDFKVKLFQVRQRLLIKSRDMNISLPRDLGMGDEISSDEDARQLMLQLRSIEKLVDLMLDLKINKLHNILPRPIVWHKLPATGEVYMEEYPTELEFTGELTGLYDLFRAILEPEHVFVVRQLRAEAAPGRPDLLKVNITLSGLVFVKDPDEMALKQNEPAVKARPKGY